ncbi:glycosyltransferase family 4 protein [Candidatus Poribacteria bacterium]|nr:glycosyltransferase family 4 protein [Candidatus Poribacteria bacterium]
MSKRERVLARSLFCLMDGISFLHEDSLMSQIINPFFELPNENPLTCHVMCVPNAPSDAYYTLSHWAQKTRNYCWMLKSIGHRVIYYGYESCNVECDEKVIVASEDVLMEAYPKCRDEFGHVDINAEPDNPDGIEYLEKRWAIETGYALKKRYKPDDIFYWTVPIGGQRRLYEELKELPVRHVEPGIGYIGAFLPHRIFQSSFIRDFHYGAYHSNLKWQDFLDAAAEQIKLGEPHFLFTCVDWEMPPKSDVVIPNPYDLSLFDFRVDKEDFLLYLGRLVNGKGIIEAVEIAERTGMKLVVAGPGNFEAAVGRKPSENIEVLGRAVGVEERRDLLSRARAVLSLARVFETFGGAAIEALLSGTVPVVANSGGFLDTIQSGYNGYRVDSNNIAAAVRAVENLDKIDPYMLRDSGLRFSRERLALQHNAYLQSLDKGEPVIVPDWDDPRGKIDWPEEWMIPVDKKEKKKSDQDS